MSETTAQDPNLNPENSPKALAPVGIKRVNNGPLILLGIVLGVFFLTIMLVAADRSKQQDERNNAPAEQRTGQSAASLAMDVTRGFEHTGYIPAAQAESPLNDIVAQQTAERLETESKAVSEPSTSVYSPEVEAIINQRPPNQLPRQQLSRQDNEQALELQRRIEQTRLRRYEEAVTARTSINLQNLGSSQGAGSGMGVQRSNSTQGQLAEVQRQLQATTAQLQSQGDPMAVYQSRLQQLQNSGLGSSGGMGASPALASLNSGASGGGDRSGYNQFEGGEDRWTLNSRLEAPQTPFVLRAGNVLPGIMISGVNSDLPGQLLAQVSQDVYDTATGRHLLIPQGSRLLGQYSSSVAYGQDRVMVAWQRIIFPDGRALDIGAMQGADGSGYSGFKDKVNHHFWRIFGSAAMMSVITAGVEMSQDRGGQDLGQRRRAGDALSEALGQQLGQATAQMIMKNLNIAPTIEIRPGYRFNVMVSKDLVFTRPYQSFDY